MFIQTVKLRKTNPSSCAVYLRPPLSGQGRAPGCRRWSAAAVAAVGTAAAAVVDTRDYTETS